MKMKNKNIIELLKPIADTFNVAVKELWGIFVKRYLVKGISEVFTAILITSPCLYYFNDVDWMVQITFSIGLIISIVLVYDAIQLIFNPSYFALNEIIKQVKGNNKDIRKEIWRY